MVWTASDCRQLDGTERNWTLFKIRSMSFLGLVLIFELLKFYQVVTPLTVSITIILAAVICCTLLLLDHLKRASLALILIMIDLVVLIMTRVFWLACLLAGLKLETEERL